MARRRVLIAVGIYPPDIGGPATFAQALFEGLPAHDVEPVLEVFSPLLHLPWGLRHFVFFTRLLRRARKAHVLLGLDPVSVGLPTWLAAAILRRPFVLRVGGDYAWEQGVQRFGLAADLDDYRHTRPAWQVRLLMAIESFVARRAATVIVPDEYLRAVVRAWGVTERKLVLVSNAPPLSDHAETPDEARTRLGLKSPVIVSIGRLVRLKGFAELLEAAKALTAEMPSLSLVIVGSGPERGRLERRIAELGLERSVRLVGSVPRENALSFLRAGDLFVLNSAGEGRPHAILEAMAVGTPVVATRSGGIPELIVDGETGRLVDPHDTAQLIRAVRELLQDPARAKRLARAARDSLGPLGPEPMIQQTLSVLNQAR